MKKKTKCVLIEEHRVVADASSAACEDISSAVPGMGPMNSIVQDLEAKTTLMIEKCERIAEPALGVKSVKKRAVRRKKNQAIASEVTALINNEATALINNEATALIDNEAIALIDKVNPNPPPATAAAKKKKKRSAATMRFKDEASEVRYDKRSRMVSLQRGAVVGVDETKKKRRKKKLSSEEEEEASSGVSSSNALLSRNLNSHDVDEAGDDTSYVSGNEDDRDSVVSAILDEDICIACGLSTMVGAMPVENVILCDGCDGEYHMQCEGLQSIPEGTFMCRRCVDDGEHYRHLPFDMPYAFSMQQQQSEVNRGGQSDECSQRSVVYSAGRPIDRAWEDCQRRGVMIVNNVFSRDIMSKLTHGTVLKITKSGRIADQWRGATLEVALRMNAGSCSDIIDRNGRYDLKLPDFVAENLQLEKHLQPILSRLTGIMGLPAPRIRTHNVVFVPVGSGIQEWHVDDSMILRKHHRYFTILIHLNPLDAYCGGTEIWMEDIQKGDLMRARPGDALVFHGSLLHRGHANNGSSHRFFYYASFACGADANTGQDD